MRKLILFNLKIPKKEILPTKYTKNQAVKKLFTVTLMASKLEYKVTAILVQSAPLKTRPGDLVVPDPYENPPITQIPMRQPLTINK